MFETIWRKKDNLKYFDSPEGKIAFIENDKGFFCLGGNAALKNFPKEKKPICGCYINKETADKLEGHFHIREIGQVYKTNLSKFNFKKPYINRIKNYAARNSYQFEYVMLADDVLFNEIKAVEKSSLRKKTLPRLGFLLSPPSQKYCEWAIVREKGVIVAVLGFNKVNQESYYLDNIISLKHRFAVDYALVSTLKFFKENKVQEVDLGLVPFQEIKSKKNIFYWGQYFNWLYSSKGLAHFKKTYTTKKEPAFCYFDKRYSLTSQIYQLAKLHLKG